MNILPRFCGRISRLSCGGRSTPQQLRTSLELHPRHPTLPAPVACAPRRTYVHTHAPTSQYDAARSSVDQSEVLHFSALASAWWDPHGSSRLLHLMNPLRHRFIQSCLSRGDCDFSQERGKLRYLDIGCGGGIFAETAARLAGTSAVTALDPTQEVIAVARKHRRTDPKLMEPGRLGYTNLALEDLPPPTAPEDGYDVVTVFEVLEHVQHPSTFLTVALKHLKPGGWLVGSTIARSTTSWLTTKLVAEEVLRVVPRGTHDWDRYINPDELRAWAQKQDHLEDWRCQGVIYVPAVGWKEVRGSEGWGNYFFGMKKGFTIP